MEVVSEMKALFLGVDSIKHDWPDLWMPVFRDAGIRVIWHSFGEWWDVAIPESGEESMGEYDIRDISDFAKWRTGDRCGGLCYSKPNLTDSEVRRVIKVVENTLGAIDPDVLCMWGNSTFQNRAAVAVSSRMGIPVLYFEGAFFRSPRTNMHMHIIDPVGVYFQGRSWLEDGWSQRKDDQISPRKIDLASSFIDRWKKDKVSKYSQGAVDWVSRVAMNRSNGRKKMFVPLQTPKDGTMWWPDTVVNSPGGLVESLVEHLPDDWYIIFKKHPMDTIPASSYMVHENTDKYVVLSDGNVHDLIDDSDGVAMINSTVGVEALAKGRRVINLGESFYSGNGWTYDVADVSEIADAANAIGDNRDLTGNDWSRFLKFMYWIVFEYLADPARDDIMMRCDSARRFSEGKVMV